MQVCVSSKNDATNEASKEEWNTSLTSLYMIKKNTHTHTHTHTFLQIGQVLIFLVLPNKEPNLVPFFVATGCLQQFLKI